MPAKQACREIGHDLKHSKHELPSCRSAPEQRGWSEVVILVIPAETQEIAYGQLRKLRALRPPEGEHTAVVQFLAVLNDEVQALGGISRAAATGDWQRVDEAARRFAQRAAAADRRAVPLGLGECLSDDG